MTLGEAWIYLSLYSVPYILTKRLVSRIHRFLMGTKICGTIAPNNDIRRTYWIPSRQGFSSSLQEKAANSQALTSKDVNKKWKNNQKTRFVLAYEKWFIIFRIRHFKWFLKNRYFSFPSVILQSYKNSHLVEVTQFNANS